METSALLQSLLLFSQVIPGLFILATPDCPASWCKTAGDCPEPKNACPSVTGCRTAVVKDKCGFCRVCLKAIGESCRRQPFKLQDDMCERGLVCKASDDEWYCANMAPENIKIGRCEKAETKRCYDLVTKTFYRTGEIWTRGEFACAACVCKRNGLLKCWDMKCKVPRCQATARVEGRCCRFCFENITANVCKFHGKAFFKNEIIVLEDHRSICKCEGSKGWECEQDPRQPMVPLKERPACVNPLSDKAYMEGEIWTVSDCAHCICGDSQTGNCSSVRCPRPWCKDPFKMKGRCCPVCPREYGRACHFQGVKYFHRELIVLPDRCTLCTCSYSRWQCYSDRCKLAELIKEPLRMRWLTGEKTKNAGRILQVKRQHLKIQTDMSKIALNFIYDPFNKCHEVSSQTLIRLQYRLWRETKTIKFMKCLSNS